MAVGPWHLGGGRGRVALLDVPRDQVMQAASPKSISALARGLDVLMLLQTSGGLRLRDIHARSGIPKASILRILKTLEQKGLIWQRMADGAYVPSQALSALAGQFDREAELVELASPIVGALTERITWPSVLAVPRLTHMEVIETNVSRAYHDEIPLGPIGFQINMLRSASGRAYLAACDPFLRDALIGRLKTSHRLGDSHARDQRYVDRFVAETEERGYAFRDSDFGGDYDLGRAQVDDGRDSLAVAIRMGRFVAGALNVTWSKRALTRAQAQDRLARQVIAAARKIETVAAARERFTGCND